MAAALDCDAALVATLRHEERLQAGTTVYLQAATLFTTPGGARRVRVHTLALPVGGSIGAIFRGADLETVVQARDRAARAPCITHDAASAQSAADACRAETRVPGGFAC